MMWMAFWSFIQFRLQEQVRLLQKQCIIIIYLTFIYFIIFSPKQKLRDKNEWMNEWSGFLTAAPR